MGYSSNRWATECWICSLNRSLRNEMRSSLWALPCAGIMWRCYSETCTRMRAIWFCRRKSRFYAFLLQMRSIQEYMWQMRSLKIPQERGNVCDLKTTMIILIQPVTKSTEDALSSGSLSVTHILSSSESDSDQIEGS